MLYGSGRENVDFRYLNDRGDIVKRSHPFEGILPNLERRRRVPWQSGQGWVLRNLASSSRTVADSVSR
ncbi:hypothetical protein [Pseudomonas aeruginosa]|uniref:hypothetical protein n=1 Tax=Pseudomonas aeruginosa TaxID=287 RepID=UPI004053DE5F